MNRHFDLQRNDDNVHSLLEPPIPAYSSTTVKRAYIIWLHLGQQPEFKQVCNFYHQLEEKERSMPPDERLKSRFRELRMYYNNATGFDQRKISAANIKQIREVMAEVCVFQLEGFCELKADRHLKSKDILTGSKIIRDYCKSRSQSLRDMFLSFEEFSKKTDTKKSFNVIMGYTRNQIIKDDLQLYLSMRDIIETQLSFLDDDFDTKYKLKKELEKSVDGTNSLLIKKLPKSPFCDAGKEGLIRPTAVRLLPNDQKTKDIFNNTPHRPIPKILSNNVL